MAKNRKKNKAIARNIAQERMEYLFGLARSEFSSNPERSARYVSLARKIGMRHRVRIPAELKRSFCRNCGSLLVQGNNSRTRSKNGYIVITCLNCGSVKRFPFSPSENK